MWVDLSPRAGHEQRGRRPVIVVSSDAYNLVSSLTLVCPITSNRNEWPWKVPVRAGSIEGMALADQLSSVDLDARGGKPSGERLDDDTLGHILGKAASLLL